MGNSNTKESRPGQPEGAGDARDRRGNPAVPVLSSRRMSRAELGFLGISNGSSSRDRPDAPFERRETRQEREARRLERERVARAKERDRSLREEHVDGGYLVTLGTYTGPEDFSKATVRQLQIERKLAPFWRGLNDWSDNWAEHQIVAAARGLPIPAPDAPPDPELVPRPPPIESSSSQNLQNLTVPMGPRTLSAASDRSGSGGGSGLSSPTTAAPTKGSSPFKPRARALAAALSGGSRNASSTDLTPKEITMPHDPFVNGQPIEVFLYKDATECPICFLTYPPYLNRTRCCDQPICSECFVQIKRADPHLPEHHPDGEVRDPHQGLTAQDPPEMLTSNPSTCPYCQQPELGVTYDPPSFRRGLSYTAPSSHLSSATAMSSQSSLNSTLPQSPQQHGRRRTHSLSATAPNVITTDRIRPDWATKLASARAHQARRSAAATALHTAAFLVGGSEQRSILRPGRFSRRNTGNNSGAASNGQSGSATPAPDAADPDAEAAPNENRDGSRRTRMDELEEMMFMEAVRLSLATEEERKRKEEKHYRKDAKKREKEERKAQKKQAKDPYGGGASSASASSLSLGLGRRRGNSAASNLRMEATVQSASQASRGEDSSPPPDRDSQPEGKTDTAGDKGKGVDRGQDGAEESSLPIPTGANRRGSHLRQMSNASSIGSSLADSPSGSYSQGFLGPDSGNPRSSELSVAGRSDEGDRDTGSEPMFNFRSLAEIVGVNIDDGSAQHHESDGSGSPGLSPGRDDIKEEPEAEAQAEAEHIEGEVPKDAAPVHQVSPPTEDQRDGQRLLGGSPPPELMITPVTPAADDEPAAEGKQLGHSIVEHTSGVVQ